MKRSSIVQTALAASLLSLLACGSSDSNGPKIQFAASGEVLALGGYAYPPASADAVAFADGWEIHFTKFLTTIDKIILSTNPDTSPTDQSQVGRKVAELDGPWAIDLHQGGPLPGKGGTGEQAFPIAVLDNQNLNGGQAFDPTVRYAFGFDLVPATAAAKFLQMQSNDPDYQDMINNGWVVLYVGTATWKGDAPGAPACTSSDSTNTFDFTKLPRVVNFRLGFKTPTTYINCQNPDNDPAKGIGGEDHERGVQVKANDTVIAQVTVHTDHPFWESIVHDSPAHFDQLAALATMGELQRDDAADGGGRLHGVQVRLAAVAVARLRGRLHRPQPEPSDGLRQPDHSAQSTRGSRNVHARLLRLHVLQPEHARALELGRPLLRAEALPISSVGPVRVDILEPACIANDVRDAHLIEFAKPPTVQQTTLCSTGRSSTSRQSLAPAHRSASRRRRCRRARRR